MGPDARIATAALALAFGCMVAPAVATAAPGNATIVSNPYGALSVQGAAVSGTTIQGWQKNAVIQLGNVAGTGTDAFRLDFQGLSLPAGNTLTIRSGAPGQSVVLSSADTTVSLIEGTLRIEAGGGAPPPLASLRNPNGVTVETTGSIQGTGGLTVVAVDATWLAGAGVVNRGVLDGGSQLWLYASRVTGGGPFKGNGIGIATYGNVNNPVNGAHFLANGLQLAPSSGTDVALSLDHYGAAAQVFNIAVTGNVLLAMPSKWSTTYPFPSNTLPALPGSVRAPGVPDPSYGPGSLIVQASGNLKLAGGASGDFVFAGGIVLKAGGTLDVNGVAIVNGWTLAGQPWQGVNFDAPSIVSSAGDIRVYTNNLNWVNFSTFPYAPVHTWQFVKQANGSAQYIAADALAPHLNTISILIEASANGQCWVCLIAHGIVDMTAPADARKDASRFLRQATFGATREYIEGLIAKGYPTWIEEQFAKPLVSHVETTKADPSYIDDYFGPTVYSFWKQIFEGEDQLRQRVTFALSQIYVVSQANKVVGNHPCGVSSYLDMLNRNAFGNWRDLLRDVTLHPAMGEYLSMRESAKSDPVLQTQPDENYAREVLQLFSIGLFMLNVDGTPMLDANGKRMPTFNEDTVKGFAKALSGWTYAGLDQSNPYRFYNSGLYDPDRVINTARLCPAWSTPMAPWLTDYMSADSSRKLPGPAHDTSAKELLSYAGAPYSFLPAGQSPQADLENLIDNVFYHPNVGPFIGRQMIQRLVTSNPSPAYVARVASKFNDNGSGVRGDMKAVVRAVLLDNDARSLAVASAPGFGKLTEPAIRFVQFHRAFSGHRLSGRYNNINLPPQLGQYPINAPSVFNFYHPDFAPAGPLAQNKLVGPEFEITTASALASYASFTQYGMVRGYYVGNPDPPSHIVVDQSRYLALTSSPAALIDELDLLLAAGGLNPVTKAQIAAAVAKVNTSSNSGWGVVEERLFMTLWLIINSPDYLVQK